VSTRSARGRRVLGLAEAVAASCLWASSGIFAVNLFRLGVPPDSVALLRPAIAALILSVALLLARRSALATDARGLLVMALGGGTAVGLFQIAYQFSMDAVGVPRTVALLYLAPAIVVAVSGPLLGEWPSLRRVGLAALTVGGVWISVLGADDVPATFGTSGIVWGVLAALGYAAYTLFGRFATPQYGSARTVLYSTAGAAMLLGVVLPLTSGPPALPPSARAWALLVVFALLTIAAAQFLFFDALGRIEASAASIAAALEPAVAALLATVLLSQGLRPIGWVGIALIVAGVVGVGVTESGGGREGEGDRP
jgi:drug/metabolite transporter (DMT)-like permease